MHAPTCENVLEGRLHIGRVQSRGLDEAERVPLGESLGLVGRHGAQVPQVRLVTCERRHDVQSQTGWRADVTRPATGPACSLTTVKHWHTSQAEGQIGSREQKMSIAGKRPGM